MRPRENRGEKRLCGFTTSWSKETQGHRLGTFASGFGMNVMHGHNCQGPHAAPQASLLRNRDSFKTKMYDEKWVTSMVRLAKADRVLSWGRLAAGESHTAVPNFFCRTQGGMSASVVI